MSTTSSTSSRGGKQSRGGKVVKEATVPVKTKAAKGAVDLTQLQSELQPFVSHQTSQNNTEQPTLGRASNDIEQTEPGSWSNFEKRHPKPMTTALFTSTPLSQTLNVQRGKNTYVKHIVTK
ncbi:hypothetical protein O0L34_g10809 [Tuta absoluta]|nr:hypothetical protein O0L34_g10809 [Tuta absoluta]